MKPSLKKKKRGHGWRQNVEDKAGARKGMGLTLNEGANKKNRAAFNCATSGEAVEKEKMTQENRRARGKI